MTPEAISSSASPAGQCVEPAAVASRTPSTVGQEHQLPRAKTGRNAGRRVVGS
jgi:hypothetical protein